jgi:hypothetical protein
MQVYLNGQGIKHIDHLPTSLFSCLVCYSKCNECLNTDEDDYYYSAVYRSTGKPFVCECEYTRMSFIPIIDPVDDYEGRELFDIPMKNGKMIPANEMCYRFIVENPATVKNLCSGAPPSIKFEILIDVGAELEYYQDLNPEFFKYMKTVDWSRVVPNSRLKKNAPVEKYVSFFKELMERIEGGKSVKIEQKENPHVSRKLKKK